MIDKFINTSGLIPHGYCLQWQPGLLWTLVSADLIIAISYFTIPFAILHFARKRPDIPHKGLFVLFGLFIVSCGVTHLFDVINVWKPSYYLDAVIRVITASFSLITAFVVWKIMPVALTAPSAKQLLEVKLQLEKSNLMLEQKVAERTQALQNANESLESAILYSPNIQFVHAEDGEIIHKSKACAVLAGFSDNEVPHISAFLDAIEPADRVSLTTKMTRAFVTYQAVTVGEIRVRTLSNQMRIMELMSTPIPYLADGRRATLTVATDITDKKESEARIQRLAHFDQLTGLPNRVLLIDRFENLLLQSKRTDSNFAVMFVDLDRFKDINDTLGHTIGDQVLMEISRRFKMQIRDQDTLARFGGDEFIFILPATDSAAAAKVAERLIKVASNAFYIQEHELTSTVSIGISIYPFDGSDMDTLIKNADTAMYKVKYAARNNYEFFTQQMQINSMRNMQLVSALRTAVANEEFEVYYQPQFDTKTRNLVGIEALLRWEHPTLGSISPTEFIPIAEDSGQIVQIGEWVLDAAIYQAKQWMMNGMPEVTLAVNLSVAQFSDPNLIDMIRTTITRYDYPAHLLELELTEAVAMRDSIGAVSIIQNLADLGVKISIDDFGTGYSSLNYLKKFKINKLKIDQSFIRDIAIDEDDKKL